MSERERESVCVGVCVRVCVFMETPLLTFMLLLLPTTCYVFDFSSLFTGRNSDSFVVVVVVVGGVAFAVVVVIVVLRLTETETRFNLFLTSWIPSQKKKKVLEKL